MILAQSSDPDLVSKVDEIVRSSIENVIDRGEGRGERNENIKAAEESAVTALSE